MAATAPARRRRRKPPTEAQVRAREDVDHQKTLDHRRRVDWPCYHQRSLAVLDAQAAVEQEETGATYALRQALIDLASCAEEIASTMPAPKRRA